MASSPGRVRGGIRIQEPGNRHSDESNAAAAATAAAPTRPAPPSDGSQERPHGPAGAEGGSPSAADSAAAAARKGKGVLAPSPLPSPTRSEGTSSPVSSDIVSDKEAGESSSADTPADGGRRLGVSWKDPLVEGTMEVPKVTRHLDPKAFDNMSLKQHWALAAEKETQKWQQVQQGKSLWSKFNGGMVNIGFTINGWPNRRYYIIGNRDNALFFKTIGRQMQNSNPHVNHQTIPMTRIIEHYNHTEMVAGRGEIVHSNALNLRRAYSDFRPVLGDGECFYRSFIFSYLEQVLERQDTHEEHRLLAAVKGVSRQHARLGWASEFSRRYKAFKTLIKKVMRWKRHNRWKNVPTTDSYRKQKLLKFFNGYGRTDDIFAFLRLVTAIWICSHSEEFEPLIPELNEYGTLREWCFDEVIRHKVFTDHVQMTALATTLGVPLRVEYLLEGDGQDIYTRQEDSQDDTPRSTCWPSRRRQLPHAHAVPRVTVLYSNIHYDIIYPHRHDGPVPSIDESCSQQSAQVQRPTAESSGQQIAQRDNCSGESSSQHIAQGEISTGESSDQHAGLTLTLTGAHEYDEDESIAE